MRRDAALDLREPVRLGVEPMEVAVEDDSDRRHFLRGQLFDRIERRQIAVQPADDIERLGLEIRQPRKNLGRIDVIGRADAAGRFCSLLCVRGGLGGADDRAHSAASFSAPPQLEPWPGGAAVAMAGGADRIARDVGVEQIGQMHALALAPCASGRSSIWLKSQS